MDLPTIHPFRKSSTPIPSDIIARICRIQLDNDWRSTIVSLALTSRRAYDVATPILYRRLTVYSPTWEPLLFGLAPERSPAAKRFEQYFSYDSVTLPKVPAASHIRKLRALSNVETLHIRGLPSLWLCKLLGILDLSVDDKSGVYPHLFSRCRYLILNPFPLRLKGPTTLSTRTSRLFCKILPYLADLSTTHACLSLNALRDSSMILERYRFASVTSHDEKIFWHCFPCDQRVFLPIGGATGNDESCVQILFDYLRMLFEHDWAYTSEYEGSDDKGDETNETDQRITQEDPSEIRNVEVIGLGACFPQGKMNELGLTEEIMERELYRRLRVSVVREGWAEKAGEAVKFTLRAVCEPCVCCGGK